MKILKIHTLKQGWCDKDHFMLHANFQLLVDFVEQERPEQIVDWNANPAHKHAWKEIRALYRWWTRARSARKGPLHRKGLKKPPLRWKKISGSENRQLVNYDKNKYAAYDTALKRHWRLEKEWDEEDQRSLHRLVEIRQFLWT